MRYAHAGREGLRRGLGEALDSVLVPVNEALRRALLLQLTELLSVAGGLELELCVFDFVLGRLGDDAALCVEA